MLEIFNVTTNPGAVDLGSATYFLNLKSNSNNLPGALPVDSFVVEEAGYCLKKFKIIHC